jgi:hypothetical protein
MTTVRNTLSNPTPEDIQEDMTEQFEEMYYSVECNTCGEIITTTLLGRDFQSSQRSGMADIIGRHNLTHYKAPVIYACEDDDIFGVTHAKCTHRIYLGA